MLRRLFAILALSCLACAAQAQMANYTVNGVEVSATAADGTTARMNAMTQAEREAFTRLLARLLPSVEAEARAAAAPEHEISRMVRGYEVQDEKVGATSYAATLDVNFDERQVQAWLHRATMPVAEMPAAPAGMPPAATVPPAVQRPELMRSNVLVLPVLVVSDTAMLWEERNVWRNAWNAAERSDTRFIRLPIGDQSDRLMVDAAQVSTAPFTAFSAIAERYQSSTVVVAEAFPTIAAGVNALGVRLRSLGREGQANAIDITYGQQEGESQSALMQRAAADIIDRIMQEGMANSTPEQPHTAPRSKLTVLSRLDKLNDWVTLRQRLQSLPGVEHVALSAISGQQVDMVVHFRGSPQRLEAAMTAQGLKVSKAANYWVLGY